MSIIRRKSNYKSFVKKISVIVLIIILIIISVNVLIKYRKVKIDEEVFSINLDDEYGGTYNTNSQENVIYMYNTLMIKMDTVFSDIFEDYDINASEQTINYRDKTVLKIYKDKNIVTIPNEYTTSSGYKIDDSVDVEIEEVNNVKYIPIYLLSNINGIEVEIDGKKVYDADKYINSLDAINHEQEEHSITINKVTIQNDRKLSDTEYVGEEEGALWREEAYKRIEKYRKKDETIKVMDQNGENINNANINIKMNDNEFKFGTAVRDVKNVNDFSDVDRSIFNMLGTENGLKWKGIYTLGYKRPEELISYANENNMSVRGHVLWIDNNSISKFDDLVGTLESPEEGTMSYIYQQYKNGNMTLEEAESQASVIKEKFENRVLDHITEVVNKFPEITEWDVANEMISSQYFKNYLYDMKFLTTKNFLTYTTKSSGTTYPDNEEYYKFLAKCFDKVKELNQNAKTVLNDNAIRADKNFHIIEEVLRSIKGIKKYTNNLDALGIQYHVQNRYEYTPQGFYNQINYALAETGVKEAVTTEYDNYIADVKDSYTTEQNEEKGKYLKDSLISVYSNINMTEFTFWVYSSQTKHFSQEELDVYKELMQEWMNHEESGITSNDGTYSTRLHKGEYTATLSIDGCNIEVPFVVSDENDDSIEIVVSEYDKKLSKVIEKYNNFENTYGEQINKLEEVKQQLNTVKQSIKNTTHETKAEDILKILEQTYEIGNKLIGNNNVEEVENILKSIEEIGNSYKGLLELNDETIDFEVDNFESEINKINNLFEINNDLEIQNLVQLKETLLNYYNEINNSQNYMKKYNYISAKYLTDYVKKLLDEKITKYMNENPVTIEYSIPESQITNQDVKVTVNKSEDTQITSDNGSNEYTFEQNGTHDFYYTRRGIEDKITATVNNIDKDPPIIVGVEANKMYVNKDITPEVKDDHLEKVELYLNDEIVSDYQENTRISIEGKYKIIATDLAENTTEVDFEISNKENVYEVGKSNLIELYDNFNKKYATQVNNSLILESQQIRNSINNTTFYTKADTIINLLNRTLNIGNKLLESDNKENVVQILCDIGNICNNYETILELNEETIELDVSDVQNKSDELNKLIKDNSDLNMEDTVDLIRLFKKYRNDIIYTENYVKKYYYIVAENLSNYINILINNKITQYIEANPITLSYSEDINKLTRNDITVTLNKGEDTKITCNNGSNVYTFSKNGSYVFSYERRGRKGKLEAKVENIDKDSPTIKGVVDGISYTSKRTPRVSDEHLDVVELYFNDEVVENYTVGSTLTEIGKYRIVATDLVGNVTAVDFEIREITDNELIETDYNVDNNFIKGVLPNTSYEQFIKNIETTSSYIIKRDGKELSINETKALATGDILEFPNVNKSYKLIVAGDINKDGNVNAKDLVRMRRYLLEQVKFDEIETCAADTNLDGKEITAKDLVRLRVMILNSK